MYFSIDIGILDEGIQDFQIFQRNSNKKTGIEFESGISIILYIIDITISVYNRKYDFEY